MFDPVTLTPTWPRVSLLDLQTSITVKQRGKYSNPNLFWKYRLMALAPLVSSICEMLSRKCRHLITLNLRFKRADYLLFWNSRFLRFTVSSTMYITLWRCRDRAVTRLIMNLSATFTYFLMVCHPSQSWMLCLWVDRLLQLPTLQFPTGSDKQFLELVSGASTLGGDFLQSFFMTLYMRRRWRDQRLESSPSSR